MVDGFFLSKNILDDPSASLPEKYSLSFPERRNMLRNKEGDPAIEDDVDDDLDDVCC